jgi:putative ABC transport system permease protein
VILGTFLGWAVVASSGSATLAVFAAPLQLVLFLVLGAVTGILAGIRPARRAARLNMISAIAT